MFPSNKTCVTCNSPKDIAEFGRNKRHPDGYQTRCRSCAARTAAEWRKRSPSYGRDWKLKSKYGLTQAAYDGMLERQQGVCAICHQTQPDAFADRPLYVDHDHKTGAVRALLCHPCNSAIGLLCDDPIRVDSAAAYLRLHATAHQESI